MIQATLGSVLLIFVHFPVLFLMETSLVFPVSELNRRSSCGSILSYLKWMTINTLTFLFLALFFVEVLWNTAYYKFNFDDIHQAFQTTYFIGSLLARIKLILLARKWLQLKARWSEWETPFNTFPYENPHESHQRFIRRLLVLTMLTTFAMLAFYTAWRLESASINIEMCHVPKHISLVAYMYVKEREHIFNFINFRPWMIPILELQYWLAEFGWVQSFNLIVVLAVWLTAHFEQLQQRIERDRGLKSESYWNEVYGHFKRLVGLVADVNRELGLLIVLNCFKRMFFLCFFLLKLIR